MAGRSMRDVGREFGLTEGYCPVDRAAGCENELLR